MSSLSRNFSPRAAVCSGGPGFYFRPQNLVQSRGLVWLKKKKKYYLAELAASWTTGGTLVGMAGEKGQRQRV